ncbi:MAG: hypothetical protein ACOC13_00970 [Tangfeifania sp.]
MKAKFFLLSLCVLFLSVGVSAKVKDAKALTGNSLTNFGKYTIVQSDAPMVVDDQVIKTFDLTYENTSAPIRIGVLEEKKNCTTFLLRSDEFEIQYSCNKNVFGVKRMDKEYCELPDEATSSKLNKVSFYSQRVICRNQKTRDELLGLIACYFPNLVNEQYQANF